MLKKSSILPTLHPLAVLPFFLLYVLPSLPFILFREHRLRKKHGTPLIRRAH